MRPVDDDHWYDDDGQVRKRNSDTDDRLAQDLPPRYGEAAHAPPEYPRHSYTAQETKAERHLRLVAQYRLRIPEKTSSGESPYPAHNTHTPTTCNITDWPVKAITPGIAEGKDPGYHWRRRLWTVDLPTLIHCNRNWCTLKQLMCTFWKLQPATVKLDPRANTQQRRRLAREEEHAVRKAAADYFHKIDMKTDAVPASFLKGIHYKLIRKLAMATIPVLMGNYVDMTTMEPVADRDPDEWLWQRAEHDGRFTLPWEWLAPHLPDGLRASLNLSTGAIVLMHLHYRCPNLFYLTTRFRKNKNNGELNAGPFSCGIIHRAMSGYAYQPKQLGVSAKQRWFCSLCWGDWAKLTDQGGTRAMLTYLGDRVVCFILDEPPEALWKAWCKERVKYYQYWEPKDTVRDDPVVLPPDGKITQVHLRGEASDAFWELATKEFHPDRTRDILAAASDSLLNTLVPETIERLSDLHIATIEDTEQGREALSQALQTDPITGEACLDKNRMKHHYQEKFDRTMLPLRTAEEMYEARRNPSNLQKAIEKEGLKTPTVGGQGPRQQRPAPTEETRAANAPSASSARDVHNDGPGPDDVILAPRATIRKPGQPKQGVYLGKAAPPPASKTSPQEGGAIGMAAGAEIIMAATAATVSGTTTSKKAPPPPPASTGEPSPVAHPPDAQQHILAPARGTHPKKPPPPHPDSAQQHTPAQASWPPKPQPPTLAGPRPKEPPPPLRRVKEPPPPLHQSWKPPPPHLREPATK